LYLVRETVPEGHCTFLEDGHFCFPKKGFSPGEVCNDQVIVSLEHTFDIIQMTVTTLLLL